MPNTYIWATLLTLAKKSVRNIPTTDIDVTHCDMVSSAMARCAVWRPQVTTIPGGTIPLVSGQQDYSVPAGIFRLDGAYLHRTDTTPHQTIELDVKDTLPTDLTQVDPYGIRNISHETGVGQLRLERAVYIPAQTALAISAISRTSNVTTITFAAAHGYSAGQSVTVAGVSDTTYNVTKPIQSVPGSTSITISNPGTNGSSSGGTVTLNIWEIRGKFEFNPTKITSTSQACWFDDKYVDTGVAGLLYWLLRLAGDPDAGTASYTNNKFSYSGQLAVFHAFLEEMKRSEDIEGETRLFPAEPISQGRETQGPYIFGW